VVARTSSFSFKGQNVDVPTIAHRLNVGAILEGSVRRAGNTVRITAQLINTVTGFHLWSDTYDRPLTDIFKVQTEVATAVAQQLETKLAGNQPAKLEVGGTKNPDAYDAYLRGRRLYETGNISTSYREALAALDQSVALDPNYAAAYATRAEVLLILWFEPKISDATALREQAIASAERAVALAPDLGDTQATLGIVHARILLDFVGASAAFDRALALTPGGAEVQREVAFYLSAIGHSEPALITAQRAVSLDPQDWSSYWYEGNVFYYARRYKEALAAYRHGHALVPDSGNVNRSFVECLIVSGQVDQARQLLETSTTAVTDRDRHHLLAITYHALGRQADAEHELDQYKKTVGDARPYRMAQIYAQWGDVPAALQSLLRAERAHDIYLVFLKVDPLLDPIRNEPQFKAFLARMKFPP
jgi:tetratricopeptide (TPR) repeat protein